MKLIIYLFNIAFRINLSISCVHLKLFSILFILFKCFHTAIQFKDNEEHDIIKPTGINIMFNILLEQNLILQKRLLRYNEK